MVVRRERVRMMTAIELKMSHGLVTRLRAVDEVSLVGCLCEGDDGHETSGEGTHCWLDVCGGTGEGGDWGSGSCGWLVGRDCWCGWRWSRC